TASTTALYVDSVIAPDVQELAEHDTVTPEHAALLAELLDQTPLGHQIVAFKVWAPGGRVAYSTNPDVIGQVLPEHEPLRRAWQGEVPSEISDLQSAENTYERGHWPRLI